MHHIFKEINVTKLYYFPDWAYLHLELKDNVEYSLETVGADFKSINELKGNAKIFVLIDMTATSFEHIPKEVMNYMANSPYKSNHVKIALIANGLGQKIFGNFYLKIFKPETNTRLFSSLHDALTWFEFTDVDTKLKSIDSALQHNS